MKKPIKVLVVDDSAVVRDYLTYIISSEAEMIVVGTAKNGKEAVMLTALKNPDIITMDLDMPIMNGFEATRQIMEATPVPIIIVTSSVEKTDVRNTFNAINAGALAFLAKPPGYDHPEFDRSRKELVNTLRIMSEVKVVTRIPMYKKERTVSDSTAGKVTCREDMTEYKITAIGASTGGPQALKILLPLIPENYCMPIVIVQHIADGFLAGMVEWLSKSIKLKVKIAENGEYLEKGTIYFCPSEFNMGIQKNLRVELKKDMPYYSVKPSVSYLFRTICKNFNYEAIGVLLTGMGKDGAEELARMKETGALTIVQDKESCVVFGMPGEAVVLNAHKYILNPKNIAKKLIEINSCLNKHIRI